MEFELAARRAHATHASRDERIEQAARKARLGQVSNTRRCADCRSHHIDAAQRRFRPEADVSLMTPFAPSGRGLRSAKKTCNPPHGRAGQRSTLSVRATINIDNGSGDLPRRGSCEERDSRRHILRFAVSTKRY